MESVLFIIDAAGLAVLSIGIFFLILTQHLMPKAIRVALYTAAFVTMLNAVDNIVFSRSVSPMPAIVHWVLAVTVFVRLAEQRRANRTRQP